MLECLPEREKGSVIISLTLSAYPDGTIKIDAKVDENEKIQVKVLPVE
jgi:hypothetical protein